MKERRNFLRVFFIMGGFGLISLFALISRPTFTDMRAVDVVHLIGTGMCFGGAIVALIVHFRAPH